MGAGALRGIGRSFVLGLGSAGFAACSWASDTAGEAVALAQLESPQAIVKAEPAARLELNATALPRLNSESVFSAPRIDMTLTPARPTAVGVAVGISGMQAQPAMVPALAAPQQAAMDVGVTMRHTFDNNQRVDVTAWRRMAQQQPDAMTLIHQREPAYGARVEWSLSRKRSGTQLKDLLGVQLEGGGRIVVRRKHGGPMIYYRNQF